MPTFTCLSSGHALSSGHLLAQQGALMSTHQQGCRLPCGTAPGGWWLECGTMTGQILAVLGLLLSRDLFQSRPRLQGSSHL